ncbi:MAG: hypothetical protein REI09_09085 [Candidatus Dactylopiibacterium sp.]|nr:hypothetical protein [Candidatus Dactylopiibacterium sp.]
MKFETNLILMTMHKSMGFRFPGANSLSSPQAEKGWGPYFWAALVVSAVLLLPSAYFGHWFPLDMPALLKVGRDFDSWFEWIVNPNNGSGRYVPVYWLYYCLNYYLFGLHLSWIYLLMAGVFLGTVALWFWAARHAIGNARAAFFLSLAIIVGSPVAENIYTIGKPEPLACFFVTVLLALFFCWRASGKAETIAKFSCLASLFVLALWSKETSLALLSFVATGLLVAAGLRPWFREYASGLLREYGLLGAVLAVGFLVSRLPYYLFPKSTSNPSYVNYEITLGMIKENLEFYLIQQPDVFLIGILSGLLMWIAARRMWREGNPASEQIRAFVFVLSLLALGWAFYLALLIWRWPMAYYMLFPSILFKFSAVYACCYVFRSRRLLGWKGVAYGAFLVSCVYGLLCFYYVASSQVQYSAVYTEAIDEYVKKSSPGESLVIESYPFYAEQIGGTKGVVAFAGKPDREIFGLADVLDPAQVDKPELLELLKVTQADLKRNYDNFPRKNDFVLVFTGRKIGTWFLRGVTPYYSEDSILKRSGAYEMELVAENSKTALAFFISLWDNKPKYEQSSVGYKLYQAKEDQPRFVWHGLYPDGWVGKEASVSIKPSYASGVRARLSIPAFSLPGVVTIYRDGKVFRKVEFHSADETVVDLADYADRVHEFRFVVDKTVSPFSLELNKDKRQLGFRVALDQIPNASGKGSSE